MFDFWKFATSKITKGNLCARNATKAFCDPFCPQFSGYLPMVGAPVHHCASCGEPIYAGEVYYLFEDVAYCKECVENFDVCELAEAFGFSDVSQL